MRTRWRSSLRWWPGAVALVLVAATATARVGTPPLSQRRPVEPLTRLPQLVLPATDVTAELAFDQRSGRTEPVRFAKPISVQVTPWTHGRWETLPEGRLWRWRVRSPRATDLNFGFSALRLPEGATLHVLAENEPYYQGPYTTQDSKAHGQLWTPVLPGDSAVLELFVPARTVAEPQLVLSQVGAGYRGLFGKNSTTTGAQVEGSCNIDVVCPQGAAWTNEIRSVGLYTLNGQWLCTGTLLADVARDFRSYFLTANHCGVNAGNAPTMVVYWNYQSTNCGTHGPGSLAQNQSGAVFRAAKYDVDFTLLELDEMPDRSFGVYYSGWDASGTVPAGGVGIHYPSFDVKAISFSTQTLATVDTCIGTGGVQTHWQVVWSAGVTERGSSGSGLWDPATHRLVGTLSGGGSSCSTPQAPDCYGKFAVAWGSGNSAAERLQDWLDPQNTGVLNVPGADPARAIVLQPAGTTLLSESCPPGNQAIDPGETVTVNFALTNRGGVSTTNMVATLLCAGGVQAPSTPQIYGVVAPLTAPVSRAFTFTVQGLCGGTISPILRLQDGAALLGQVAFNLPLGAPVPTVTFDESFAAGQPPALPAGWSSVGKGGTWKLTGPTDTLPNAAFAPDPGSISDVSLVSPAVPIKASLTQVSFRHQFGFESGYDGGVLEIAVGNGVFTDILAAGGSFLTEGYTQSLSTYYGNPLAGRLAWSGDSGGWITTVVNLPAAAGQNLRLRWRIGSDNSTGGTGWYVDSISLTQTLYSCCVSAPLLLEVIRVGTQSLAFSYDTLAGRSYSVEATTNLSTPAWSVIQTTTGDGTRQSVTNSLVDSEARYFRLLVQ